MTYENKLALYYDKLYSHKDYEKEAKFILDSSGYKGSLLDVGAGTCSHTAILAKSYDKVSAVDMSYSMMAIGKQKLVDDKIENVRTYIGTLEKLMFNKEFDTCISMFNVVNHIQTISELRLFFAEIYKALKQDGIFIFDCWNGSACYQEKPKEHTVKSIKVGEYELKSTTITKTDLFHLGKAVMNTTVNVFRQDTLLDSFDYEMSHRLWTADILTELLNEADLAPIKICKSSDYQQASQNDFRITFVCLKGG